MRIIIQRPSIDDTIYWGAFIFIATLMTYFLVTLIQLSSVEDTAFSSEGAKYMRKQARVAVITTSMGEIRVNLLRAQAPTTVNNFVALAQTGFYDNTKFHRVVGGSLIQGGDPLSRESDKALYGTGGPGYVFDDEIRGEKMVRGVVAMANLGRPKTNGSQFFILVAEDAPAMEGKYTIFGKVIDGLPVADAISKIKVDENKVPLTPVIVESITVER